MVTFSRYTYLQKRQIASKYRPICLQSAILKMTESIIAKELRKFASETNLIPDIQHGFTAGKSDITNLFCCLNDWTRNVDLNLPVDVLYLDCARDFDKVPINRLLFKLDHLDI